MSEQSAPEVGEEIVSALIAAGIAGLVLSPGFRSAPLSVSAARHAAAGDLELLVRVDERSAAFTALGWAKATGLPTAVMCTSGTATANFLPAIVEARYSGAPLVVVTADRPPQVRGSGASQTIDQVGMFDQFVLGSTDLVATSPAGAAAAAVHASVALADRARGPVQLNVPFTPPLVADAPVAAPAPELVAAPDPTPAGEAAVADLGELPARGVMVVGDLDLPDSQTRERIAATAAEWGWPILAEPTAGLTDASTAIPGAAGFLTDSAVRAELRADLVVTVGPFGLSRGVLELVREAERHVAVRLRPRTDPPDPLRTAEQVLPTLPTGTVSPDPSWLAQWRTAAQQSRQRGEPLANMMAVAEEIWAVLSPADLLVVAPSLPIRAFDQCSGPGPAVLSNRGANGIDGVVSTAWGAAHGWHSGRTVALLGDLALLHDQNGLLVPSTESEPNLTLVVADNNGGGIFSQVEANSPANEDVFERVFGTPHDRDLVDVLAAAGVSAQRLGSPTDVGAALSASQRDSGIRAFVVSVDR